MPTKQRIFWKLFPAYLVTVLVAVVAVSWYFTVSLRTFYETITARELSALARLVAGRLQSDPRLLEGDGTDLYCKETGALADCRMTVILASGRVIGDTDEEPARMENHADRPEIQAALTGRQGSSTRFSNTLDAQMMYRAAPVVVGHDVPAVVRAARPLTQMRDTLAAVQRRLGFSALIIAAAATVVSLTVARRLARPLEAMRTGAERFARGDLGFKLAEPDSVELSQLAEAMNLMAAQLANRIETITQERNEVAAILSGMTEGVLAVDKDECIITVNQAALTMLASELREPQGRPLQEVVRNPALQRFVQATLTGQEKLTGEVTIYGPESERCLQTHGAPLENVNHERFGAVVVLNDITELRRLENLRREFVANVSHELRTPVTSLKGFVETLLDGAVNDPENAERFLRIVLKHADRLSAIIEDLLLLARIEKEQEETPVDLLPIAVSEVIDDACRVCRTRAEQEDITLAVECAAGLTVRGDAGLLSQALINLVDNAINYSDRGSSVEIVAGVHGEEVHIDVRDQGCGIGKNHLLRIFERFYRADKARSREQGGTGLGLAIVKHIVQVHKGRVTVASELGKGSTFTILLPADTSGSSSVSGRSG